MALTQERAFSSLDFQEFASDATPADFWAGALKGIGVLQRNRCGKSSEARTHFTDALQLACKRGVE